MRLPAICLGIVLIVLVAQDAFETIVLPRRVTRRIRGKRGLSCCFTLIISREQHG